MQTLLHKSFIWNNLFYLLTDFCETMRHYRPVIQYQSGLRHKYDMNFKTLVLCFALSFYTFLSCKISWGFFLGCDTFYYSAFSDSFWLWLWKPDWNFCVISLQPLCCQTFCFKLVCLHFLCSLCILFSFVVTFLLSQLHSFHSLFSNHLPWLNIPQYICSLSDHISCVSVTRLCHLICSANVKTNVLQLLHFH